jgi:hypothetical protein
MMLPEALITKYLARFDELIKEGEDLLTRIRTEKQFSGNSWMTGEPQYRTVHLFSENQRKHKWGNNIINLLERLLPLNDPNRKFIEQLNEGIPNNPGVFKKVLGTLQAIREDIEKGFIEDIRLSILNAKAPKKSTNQNNTRNRRKRFENASISALCKEIWTPGLINAFISHKDEYKVHASQLKDELAKYGISGFVAHKDIIPSRAWPEKIEHALLTMDAFLALLTDDYHNSYWTDHEVGAAFGRSIPIIPVRLGKIEPYGLFGKYQAMQGDWKEIPSLAGEIYGVLMNYISISNHLKKYALNALRESTSYMDTNFIVANMVGRFNSLTRKEFSHIQESFRSNDQIYSCTFACNNLPDILTKITGYQVININGEIRKKYDKIR